MDMTAIYRDHSDIIFTAPNRIPIQEVINLDKYLNRIFPNSDLFIPEFDLQNLRNSLNEKYSNDTDCFKKHGELRDIEFSKLKYYQPDVGISGPRHSKITDPVYVVNYLGKDILFNGYHRSLFKLSQGQQAITAYYLTV